MATTKEVTRMSKVFSSEFDAILLPGETAHVITANEEFDAECVAVGALPEYQKDFGALTATTWDENNEDTNLEMSTLELAQHRMRVVDDIKLRFNNLAPTRQWRTSKADFYLRQFPQETGEEFLKSYMFKASEFFIYEDDTPRFDFYSDIALTTSRVKFSGWRLKLKKIPTRGKAVIWVSGWPTGTK